MRGLHSNQVRHTFLNPLPAPPQNVKAQCGFVLIWLAWFCPVESSDVMLPLAVVACQQSVRWNPLWTLLVYLCGKQKDWHKDRIMNHQQPRLCEEESLPMLILYPAGLTRGHEASSPQPPIVRCVKSAPHYFLAPIMAAICIRIWM